MVSIDKPPQKLTRLKAKERKMIRDEEETTATTTICDILPTLANTVIPMARYETVRLQTRRRAPANAGVTHRTRNDTLFKDTEPLRIKYKTIKKDWPVNAFALSGLDGEIYRRVFARQDVNSPFHDEKIFKKYILYPIDEHIDEYKKPTNRVTSISQQQAYDNLLAAAADPVLMKAAMGTDIFAGNLDTSAVIEKEMKDNNWITTEIMGYILRVYLAVPQYDRIVVIDPHVWTSVVALHKPPPNWWLAAEVFQYKIPPEALPLGTDASDKILLNRCGISLVLFLMNQEDRHWSLLAYPVRKDPTKRRLYHYDSGADKNTWKIQSLTEQPRVQVVARGLFSSDIFDTREDDPMKHLYVTNPGFQPRALGCKQPSGWRCGYIAIGIVDILCRKTEANPNHMNNPATLDSKDMDPLQPEDIPTSAGTTTAAKHRIADYVDSLLKEAKAWADNVALLTVWRIREPATAYVHTKKNPKPKPVPISAVFEANTSWQSFSWDDYDD